MYRFFTPAKLTLNSPVELSDEEMHHLKKVLRVKPGEAIELVNGKGELAHAVYNDPIVILSIDPASPPTPTKALVQAIPEKSHLEFILEKGTELGITDFYLFPAARSKLKELSHNYIERLEKILLASLKQCKRLFLPKLHINAPLPELKFYLGDPKGDSFTPYEGAKAFIIGPESGFTPEEIESFKAKQKAIPTKLSNNILRTETAATVASFLLCQETGNARKASV